MYKLIFCILLVFFSACTISIVQTDTHGYASDVVDETASTDVKADANLEIPVKPI